MDEKDTFGQISASDFEIGNIVEWSVWDTEEEVWKPQYGMLLDVENEIRANRLVSIAKVMPLQGPKTELEFFAMSLRIVSKTPKKKNK